MSLSLTFVAAVNNIETLNGSLLKSPCLQTGEHQLLITHGASSAAEAYNKAFEEATGDILVFLHQDVWLPEGWSKVLLQRYGEVLQSEAWRVAADVSVVGAYGVDKTGQRFGKVMSHGKPLIEETPLPAEVQTLDEFLLVLPRSSKLRFDPTMGFHFYGCDIAMQARKQGGFAIVVDALAHHDYFSKHPFFTDFEARKTVFRGKWGERPIYTSCTLIKD